MGLWGEIMRRYFAISLVLSALTTATYADELTADDDAYLAIAFGYSPAEIKSLHEKSASCQAVLDAAINDPKTMYNAAARYDEVTEALAVIKKHPGNESCAPESDNPTN